MLSRVASTTARQCTSIVARGSSSATGGQRDEVNFPRPVRLPPSKVRLGFLPEEWFTFFHSKTGVTGPYVFGLGLTTYLCSKEIYIMEHEFYAGLSVGLMCIGACKKFGPGIAKWLDKEIDDFEAKWNENRQNKIKELTNSIEGEKKAQWSAEGQEILIAAKKENVLLQLEAAYRERMMGVYNEVKKRLDYQVAKSNSERRIEQKHMVDWIVSNVRKAITPDQEKQALDRCIADLAAIAGKSK